MSRSTRTGLTLIEVLVVFAILAIVVLMFGPALRHVRGPAERASCQNNLHQLMMAMHSDETTGRPAPYRATGHADSSGSRIFPPGCIGPGTRPEERLSWMVTLLPNLEQDSLYRQFDLEKGYAANLPAAQTRIKIFLCPAVKEADTDAVTN
jgi:prepilin-type N-terminal cleavage/methylation domain-containing protein